MTACEKSSPTAEHDERQVFRVWRHLRWRIKITRKRELPNREGIENESKLNLGLIGTSI